MMVKQAIAMQRLEAFDKVLDKVCEVQEKLTSIQVEHAVSIKMLLRVTYGVLGCVGVGVIGSILQLILKGHVEMPK